MTSPADMLYRSKAVEILAPVLALIPDGHAEQIIGRLEEALRTSGPSVPLENAVRAALKKLNDHGNGTRWQATKILQDALDATRSET